MRPKAYIHLLTLVCSHLSTCQCVVFTRYHPEPGHYSHTTGSTGTVSQGVFLKRLAENYSCFEYKFVWAKCVVLALVDTVTTKPCCENSRVCQRGKNSPMSSKKTLFSKTILESNKLGLSWAKLRISSFKFCTLWY